MASRALRPAACALGGAALFGIATPLEKILLGDLSPEVLGGLLYLSSGAVLAVWLLLRRRRFARFPRRTLAVVAAVAALGGIAAPLALLHGLSRVEGQVASLLLALEGPFTALFAALLFREHVGGAAWLAVGLAAAGAVALAEPWAGGKAAGDAAGLLLVVGATALWALDNNLSRSISHEDPVRLTAWKGLLAGPALLGFGIVLGHAVPRDPGLLAGAAAVGVGSHGISLVLVLSAFAGLGAARTMALFATAPAVGAVSSWIFLGERPGAGVAVATPLLAAAVWILSRETHDHIHEHDPLEHEHEHVHDEHHVHAHRGDEGPEPHTHPHRHAPLVHAHRHVPDLHHRHGHPPSGGS